ncbi:MAG: FAD-binding protein, partial [Planctomycetaceae bacterium]|nr:FAD-binding protein [Planctomycetaceae bacterium]
MAMDEQRARIEEDLRGLLDGDVRADDVFLQLYASDASIYQLEPLAVVLPRSTADVAATVRYAVANQLPIHARGAGTGLAGESLGPGIVVDFSKHFRRILGASEESVLVQPGLVLERLNTYLRAFGRHFGPDPAMSQVTTLGSVIALNAAGSHWLKHGATDRHIEQLQVVLADGEVIEAGCEPLVDGVNYDPHPRKRALVNELAALLASESDTIRKHQPRTKVNRAGYALANVLHPDHLNLGRLLCGSEGTLGLVTEARLHTTPLARHRGVALLFFDSLEGAAKAVLDLLPLGPTACDLMDRRHVGLARETEPRFDLLIPPATEALLLVEQEGADTADVRERLRNVIARVRQRKSSAFDARQAFDPDEIDLYWQLAQKVVPTLQRMRGLTRALPGIEDMAVPPEALPGFLVQIQNVLKRHHVTASLFAHAGHGQLHLRPFLDPSNPDDVQTLWRVATDLYEALFAVGGTISGEHGDGLSRTAFLPRQYGDLYRVFREVKRIFDPHNVFNPGKVVGDDPELMTRHIRVPAGPGADSAATGTTAPAGNGDAPADPALPLVDLQLVWSRDDVAEMADRCNGCGACRALGPEVRMCPIFRFAPAEEASPRAKANLMRGVLSGQIDPAALATDEFKAVADLCVNCQMCRLECPANVDIPRLMLEAKGAYVSANGQGVREWLLARIDLLSSVASLIYPLTNWAIANRQARWVLEKVLGLAQGRKLPRAASQTF